jgi:hypothetical protein
VSRRVALARQNSHLLKRSKPSWRGVWTKLRLVTFVPF